MEWHALRGGGKYELCEEAVVPYPDSWRTNRQEVCIQNDNNRVLHSTDCDQHRDKEKDILFLFHATM